MIVDTTDASTFSEHINHISSQEQVDIIAKTQFTSNNKYDCDKLADALAKEAPKNQKRLLISSTEINWAIKELRDKKYTSPQGIRMDIFYICASQYIHEQISTAARMSFATGNIPKGCQLTKGTVIPKKEPGKYRIVHVSNPMAALLELIALRRLEYALESLALNDEKQYGFTASKDRHDMVTELVNMITKDQWNDLPNNKRVTTIIGLDIKGAFDNVSHRTLIEAMNNDIKLESNNIKFWLAKFITRRKIVLRYGSWHSKPRDICKGVPQGSALGPILFNFAIRSVKPDVNMNDQESWSTKIEIYKYADDLHIIQKGYNPEQMQATINSITSQLNKLGLSINPAKCSCLPITNFANITRSLTHDQYTVNTPGLNNTDDSNKITVTDKLNILGIMINKNLRLDRERAKNKIDNATRKLFNIQVLNIVNKSQEWRILIESYLISVTIYNCWPILALNAVDRAWLDKKILRAIKIIFNWPSNIATKTIRLVLDLHATETLIEKIIRLRCAKDQQPHSYSSYIRLLRLLKESKTCSGRGRLIRMLQPDDDEHLVQRQRHCPISNRTCPNPDILLLQPIELVSLNEAYLSEFGPFWFLLGRKAFSMAVETYGHHILDIRAAVNTTYQIEYFNTMTLLWILVKDSSIINRKVILPADSPLLSAIYNARNQDWRVIELREMICNNHWRIFRVREGVHNLIKFNLIHLRSLILVTKTGDESDANITMTDNGVNDESTDDDMEGRINPRNTDHIDDDMRQLVQIQVPNNYDNFPRILRDMESRWKDHRVVCIQSQVPNLSDYLRKHIISSRMNKDMHTIRSQQFMTRICATVSNGDANIWQSFPPNLLTGANMLMLSDMYQNGTTGALTKFDGSQVACEICLQALADPNSNMHLHITAHRATNCSGFTEQVNALKDTLSRYDFDMRKALRDNQHSLRIIKILSECALKAPQVNENEEG
jgi:hypothetical protein